MSEIIYTPKESTSKLLLKCDHVTKSYTGRKGQEVSILRDINLTVNAGEIVIITGRSGCGKTTLLTLLAGLDRPTSGSINLDGEELQSLDNEKLANLRRNKIGIIFQNFNLLPSWTAFENIEAALLHTGMLISERAEKITALLEQLGLTAQQDNLPAEMSMGQQQRVAIARTLVHTPTLILADEPTGDVDPETAKEIIELLLIPVREHGATLVITTHGNFPLEIADRVIILSDGIIKNDQEIIDLEGEIA
jgi:putative ABC transport system ATP-binding protein